MRVTDSWKKKINLWNLVEQGYLSTQLTQSWNFQDKTAAFFLIELTFSSDFIQFAPEIPSTNCWMQYASSDLSIAVINGILSQMQC